MSRLVVKAVEASIGLIFLTLIMIESSYANSKPGGDFSLIDQDQHEFQLHQLRGKVVLLFFG